METLNYQGPANLAVLHKWAAKQSEKGGYVVFSIVFGQVIASRRDALPSSDHAANDWPVGYWHKGAHKEWSEARRIRSQNAGMTND